MKENLKSLNDPDSILIDSFNKVINYLRLAVTDRCNLRCLYCLPEKISSVSKKEALTFEESLRLIKIFSSLGINKLRITGGEPFVRKGLISFLESIKELNLPVSIYITTNGVLTYQFLNKLKDIGIDGINLSLDTLNKQKFKLISGKEFLDSVLRTFYEIVNLEIPLKINSVIIKNFNESEIESLASLARDKNIQVRFIEQMPFNGKPGSIEFISGKKILNILQGLFVGIFPLPENGSSSRLYSIPGFKGHVGIIESYTRSFCGSCSRIRITPAGILKVCLYDNGILDLREMLMSGYSDHEIKEAVKNSVRKKSINGFEAERASRLNKNSMALIGG